MSEERLQRADLWLSLPANAIALATFALAAATYLRKAPINVVLIVAVLVALAGGVLLRWRWGRPGKLAPIAAVALLLAGGVAGGTVIGQRSVSVAENLTLDDAISRTPPCSKQSWHDDPGMLGGEMHPAAILCPVYDPNLEAKLEFNARDALPRITMIAGIDERSDNSSVRLLVTVLCAPDNRRLAEPPPIMFRQPAPITVLLDGCPRFAIRVKVLDNADNSAKMRSFSAVIADLKADRS
jgi:hypothetical protein